MLSHITTFRRGESLFFPLLHAKRCKKERAPLIKKILEINQPHLYQPRSIQAIRFQNYKNRIKEIKIPAPTREEIIQQQAQLYQGEEKDLVEENKELKSKLDVARAQLSSLQSELYQNLMELRATREQFYREVETSYNQVGLEFARSIAHIARTHQFLMNSIDSHQNFTQKDTKISHASKNLHQNIEAALSLSHVSSISPKSGEVFDETTMETSIKNYNAEKVTRVTHLAYPGYQWSPSSLSSPSSSSSPSPPDPSAAVVLQKAIVFTE